MSVQVPTYTYLIKYTLILKNLLRVLLLYFCGKMSQQALRKQKLEKLQQISSMRILAKQVMFVQTVLLHGKILHLWSTERKSDWNLILVYKGKGQETKQNKAQGRLCILICRANSERFNSEWLRGVFRTCF